MKNVIPLITLLLITLLATPTQAVTVYLVRHAEKQAGDDPALTETGELRARNLAMLLKDAGVRHVFSTEYRRTLATARPLAAGLQLEIQTYDPENLTDFARQLRRLNGAVLVVGHSNTTPQLVEFLGGNAEPMTDAEYTRVYRLQLGAGSTHTLLLHLPPESDPLPGASGMVQPNQ